MEAAALERVRVHRRLLAARWADLIASTSGLSVWWQDAERVGRWTLTGMNAVCEALVADRPEPFAEFAARLSQEAFAFGVPLHEVVRVVLEVKPVLLGFLAEAPDHPSAGEEFLRRLDHASVTAVLEGIRHHERQRDRRTVAARRQLEELRERLRRQVIIDPATGLFNANYFHIMLRREVRRYRRFTRGFTAALVALDQDEEIRDAWGDEGLRAMTAQLADVLSRITRQVDIRAALGPGRFGLILPETPLEGGLIVAERIRGAVEQHPFTLPEEPLPMTQTVSVGLAAFPQDAEDDQGLLQRLEEALALARSGRNATVAAASAENLSL
ncbi:MAG: diguanylate cyclase [Armatimonadota bacterium]|nr:diguanylate cyclase [Armatimonadota bacterium]